MSVNTHLHVRDVMKLRYIITLWCYVFATHNDQIQVFFLQNALVEYIGVYSGTNKRFRHLTSNKHLTVGVRCTSPELPPISCRQKKFLLYWSVISCIHRQQVLNDSPIYPIFLHQDILEHEGKKKQKMFLFISKVPKLPSVKNSKLVNFAEIGIFWI